MKHLPSEWRRDMNIAWKLVPAALAVATLAACGSRTVIRETVREQPVVQQAPVVERVTVVQPPPAPQEVQPPAPSVSGYSWVPGHYVWADTRWVWQPGQWRAGTIRPMPSPMTETPPSAPPEGRTQWVPGYWSFQGNDWVWINGRWV
jgi:WXXGXW repeat (2 copies)